VRLVVVTPQAVVVDRDVVHVRAEDRSGAFGVLDRHADLITALTVSVLVYRDLDQSEHFLAVRGGLLTVTGRRKVEVLTREAVPGDDLQQLEREVLARFRRTVDSEELARRGAGRLEGALLRRVADYVRDPRRRNDRGMAR
jgi:F-type H+-transporting ATPase subunit epsilon